LTTLSEKRIALRSWISGVTGLSVEKVILSNAGGPMPLGDFCFFSDPKTEDEQCVPFVAKVENSEGVIELQHVSFCTVVVDVDFFSENGGGYLDNLRMSIGDYRFRGLLSQADMAFIRKSSNVYVPEYDDTRPVNRWRASFYFSTQVNYAEQDFDLQSVTGTLNFENPNGDKTPADFEIGESGEEEL